MLQVKRSSQKQEIVGRVFTDANAWLLENAQPFWTHP